MTILPMFKAAPHFQGDDDDDSMGESYEVTISVISDSALDPSGRHGLTTLERCRLLAQLGRRCAIDSLNRWRALERQLPGICEAVGDFVRGYRYPDCLEKAKFPTRLKNI